MKAIQPIPIRLMLIIFTILGILYPMNAQEFVLIDTSIVCMQEGKSRIGVWADFNNDGFLDVIVNNGDFSESTFRHFMFLNHGDWNFTNVTDDPITLEKTGYSTPGFCAADYNNDGFTDVFIPSVMNYSNTLFKNNGDANFTLVSIGEPSTDLGDSGNSLWLDVDNDGNVDLYVNNLRSQRNMLYRNHGNEQLIKTKGGDLLNDIRFVSFGCSASDIEADGDLDLYCITLDTGERLLYKNDGFGNYHLDSTSGLTDKEITTYGWIPPIWGDYDNDNDLDVFMPTWSTSWGAEYDLLFENLGNGKFEAITGIQPVADKTQYDCASWGDIDNDGYLDLVVSAYGSLDNRIYMNNGDGSFEKIDTSVYSRTNGGHPSLVDINNDGFLDIFLARGLYPPESEVMFANQGNSNGWLKITPVGTVSNKSAIGTRISAKAQINGKEIWQVRETGLNPNGFDAHFGLGDATQVDTLIIKWPTGKDTMLYNLSVNQHLTINENIASNYLKASFAADTNYGIDTLGVQFTDISTASQVSPLTAWSWDFNGDGIEDSDQQNPYYLYSDIDGGIYDVTLKVTNGIDTSIMTKEKYIKLKKAHPNIGDDIADWAVATASSVEDIFTVPERVNDNELVTRWGSQHYNDPEWIQLEFDTVYSIGKVIINWEAAYAEEFKLATSLDTITWDTVFCSCSGDGGIDTINFTSSNARYLKVIGFERTKTQWGYFGYSIYEIEVYHSDDNIYESGCSQSCDVTSITKLENTPLNVYPNPFKTQVNFSFNLTADSNVDISLFDVSGKKVATIFSDMLLEGYHTIKWNNKDLSPGIYFFKFNAPDSNLLISDKLIIAK